MTKTTKTKRRGAVKQPAPFIINMGVGMQRAVDLSDGIRRRMVGLAVVRHVDSTDGLTRSSFAKKAGKGITTNLLARLLNGEGKLTADRYCAIRGLLPDSDAEILLTREECAEFMAEGKVTPLFPPASVKVPSGAEPVNWKEIFATLLDTGCIDRDVAVGCWIDDLRGQAKLPYRELVLSTINDLVNGDVTLGQVWREPPLAHFVRRVTGEDILTIQDILAQRTEQAQTA